MQPGQFPPKAPARDGRTPGDARRKTRGECFAARLCGSSWTGGAGFFYRNCRVTNPASFDEACFVRERLIPEINCIVPATRNRERAPKCLMANDCVAQMDAPL